VALPKSMGAPEKMFRRFAPDLCPHTSKLLPAPLQGRRQTGSRGCSAPPRKFSSTGTEAWL